MHIIETRRDVYQAIADPTRRGILTMLINKPQNLNTIADQFEMSRQAVSLHVKILTECGIITVSRKGRERYCLLQPKKLTEVAEWLQQFAQMWEDKFNELDNILIKLKDKKK